MLTELTGADVLQPFRRTLLRKRTETHVVLVFLVVENVIVRRVVTGRYAVLFDLFTVSQWPYPAQILVVYVDNVRLGDVTWRK